MCPEATRAPAAQLYVEQLPQSTPDLAQASMVSPALLTLVRERRGGALTSWRTEAPMSGMAALARLAQGLQEDRAALTAGLTLPWSHGPVEGQGNRRKRRKRQGYGRADVGLWRQRLMPAA
jgi:transposase